jgi:hypothetical protein
MLACRNAKRFERLNVMDVQGFVISGVERDFDVDSSGPGINSALNLF